jgi:hypothetical protein
MPFTNSDVTLPPLLDEDTSRRLADAVFIADTCFQLGGELALRVVRYAHVSGGRLGPGQGRAGGALGRAGQGAGALGRAGKGVGMKRCLGARCTGEG